MLNFSKAAESQSKRASVSVSRQDVESAIQSYLEFCFKHGAIHKGEHIKVEIGTSKQGTFPAFRALIVDGKKVVRKLSKIVVFNANAYKSRGRDAEFGKVSETLDLGAVS